MKAKEKAISIIKETVSLVNDWNPQWAENKTIEEIKRDRDHRWWNSKRVAIRQVEEMIKNAPTIETIIKKDLPTSMLSKEYLQEVKQELNKL